MRKYLLGAVVALSGAAIVGIGNRANSAPPPEQRREERREEHWGRAEAEKAMRDYYGPTAQVHVAEEFESNGVKCFEGDVNRDGLPAKATVTATGYLITMGLPQPATVLPPAAQLTAALFKAPLQSLTQEEFHGFYLTVTGPAHKPFVIAMDATGKIRDIKAPEQIFEDAASTGRVVGPEHREIVELAHKRFAKEQVDGVQPALHDPGYFSVGLKNQLGRGWAIISPQNDVTEYRIATEFRALPEPVRRAVERDLHGDHVTNVQEGTERLYRMAIALAGNQVVMLVKPNGSVEWINSRELHIHHEMPH